MAITFTYAESTNLVVLTEGTSGTPADFDDFVHFDRTVATTACTIASGAELKAATAVGNPTDLTLTYPMRPVEFKALRLSITTAQNGGAAVSGDETVDIYGTTSNWQKMTGASASGQKVVPIADLTHNYKVGDTVILIDISAPATYETDTIASIQEGVSITMTNNNTNAYAIGDIVGIYRTEQIDVSAAFATYLSKKYGQIAKMTFTGFDGTNTAKVDQPIWGVIWDYGNGQYKIDSKFDIGDNSTTTYFASRNEMVYFYNVRLRVRTSATCEVGAAATTYSKNGSFWKVYGPGWGGPFITEGGTFKLYGSILEFYNNVLYFSTGTLYIYDSIIQCKLTNVDFGINSAMTNLYVRNLYLAGTSGFLLQKSPAEMSDVLMDGSGGYGFYVGADTTIKDCLSVNAAWNNYRLSTAHTFNIINSRSNLATPDIGNASGVIKEQYYCNIHVADKDGANLSGVSVACEDTSANAAFTTQTTAADGTITEQTITYKQWVGTAETLTDYSPHKFTLSKAGYETLILENITVDGAIDWHLELQPIRSRALGRGDRRMSMHNFE